MDDFFVITGGPGAGKSALIAALEAEGFRCSAEAGRAIIRQQAAIGGRALPWVEPALFAELMLSWEMRAHAAMSERPGVAFFDRGVPDVIGYLRLLGSSVPPHMTRAAERHRYNRTVFVCPPWPEIFAQDEERRQTPEEAERTFDAMLRTYADCGYDLVEVPRAPVPERLAFVLRASGIAPGRNGEAIAPQPSRPSW
jgi:predicted ATPase